MWKISVTGHNTNVFVLLQLVLAALAAVAAAAPQQQPPVAILLDERVPPENGAYSFQFQAENGIVQSETGAPGSQGQTNVQGVFR